MRRTLVEWVVTLGVAGLFVLVFEVEIAQPFRVPTSSMEPTLQCAEPGSGCTGRLNDRVLVAKIVYRFRDPKPPAGFSQVCEFRRCVGCGSLTLVKGGVFECGVCGAELPGRWNFG